MGISGEFGPTLIGGVVSFMLYGITIFQTYVYFMHYAEDGLAMKFLVAAILCHYLYYYLITNYGVPTGLDYVVWSFPASILINSLLVLSVQCFFAHKIYYLCRPQVRRLVTAPIVLFVFAHWGFSVETAVLMFVNNKTSDLTQFTSYAVIPGLATIVLTEVLIAGALCVLFYDSGSHSSFRRTKRLLNMLIIYAVNRCLLTLLLAVAQLVTSVLHQDAWSIGMDFIMAKRQSSMLCKRCITELPGTPSIPNLRYRVRSTHRHYPPRQRVVDFRRCREFKEWCKVVRRMRRGVVDPTTNLALDKTTAREVRHK